MAKNLEVATELGAFKESVRNIATSLESPMGVDESIRLCKLGGGVIQFARTVFFDTEFTSVHAELYDREPQGRGAHFDLYQDLLDDRFPYIGVFNLSGEAKVTAACLPDDLTKAYFERYPEPNDAAAQARRQFSAIVLQDPKVDVYEGKLEAGSGMVIAQRKDQPHVIHSIEPLDTNNPGKFVKFAYLEGSTKKVLKAAKDIGMRSLDELLTDNLSGVSAQLPQDLTDYISEVPPGVLPSDHSRLISSQAGYRRPGLSSGNRRD